MDPCTYNSKNFNFAFNLIAGGMAKTSYSSKIWPAPPDVEDVNREASRLAAEALTRAALQAQAR